MNLNLLRSWWQFSAVTRLFCLPLLKQGWTQHFVLVASSYCLLLEHQIRNMSSLSDSTLIEKQCISSEQISSGVRATYRIASVASTSHCHRIASCVVCVCVCVVAAWCTGTCMCYDDASRLALRHDGETERGLGRSKPWEWENKKLTSGAYIHD